MLVENSYLRKHNYSFFPNRPIQIPQDASGAASGVAGNTPHAGPAPGGDGSEDIGAAAGPAEVSLPPRATPLQPNGTPLSASALSTAPLGGNLPTSGTPRPTPVLGTGPPFHRMAEAGGPTPGMPPPSPRGPDPSADPSEDPSRGTPLAAEGLELSSPEKASLGKRKRPGTCSLRF